MKLKTCSSLVLGMVLSSAQADTSWNFKLLNQNLDAQYTVDIKAGPHIIFTKIPEKGSHELWEGYVVNAPQNQYKLAVLTFTDAWYTKPWYSVPDIQINLDGSFTFDISTGDGNPENATQVSVNLVPQELETPIATGFREIPKSIVNQSVFSVTVPR